MSWITTAQADNFLRPNTLWDEFPESLKEELVKLASNRLDQLTFKDEPIERVGAKFIDGVSTIKVSAKNDYLIDAQAGNWDYQEALGWQRSSASVVLVVYSDESAFIIPDNSPQILNVWRYLSFKDIQSTHSFGCEFGGNALLKLPDGDKGFVTTFETEQANSIVGADGEQVFDNEPARRLNASYRHNGVVVFLIASEGTQGVVFNGTDIVEVINEQGETVENIVPLVVPDKYFTYKVKVIDGLDKTMYLYVDDILVGNPTFAVNTGGKDDNRLLYTSGSSGGVDRISYFRSFGTIINVENPKTIPIRLVGACSLLAFEYGNFPPSVVGDKEYLQNENDYHRMQDLPINIQSALEPFLDTYEGVIDNDGVATINDRGVEPLEPKKTLKVLDYS